MAYAVSNGTYDGHPLEVRVIYSNHSFQPSDFPDGIPEGILGEHIHVTVRSLQPWDGGLLPCFWEEWGLTDCVEYLAKDWRLGHMKGTVEYSRKFTLSIEKYRQLRRKREQEKRGRVPPR